MIKQSEVTAIIPHLGWTEEQERSFTLCLKSLEETVPEIDILIAKNGEISCTQNHRQDVWVREQGQCKAVNAAAATVDTEWLFITNDDMVYAPGWFERLTGWASKIWFPEEGKSEDILCISPKLIEPRAGAPTFEVKNFGGAGGDFSKQSWLEYAKSHKGEGIRTGFNLPFLVKKELFDLVENYDVKYDPWGASSDTDLQCKFELAGAKTWQNTNCCVYHFSQTSGTFHPDNQGDWQKNYAYFQGKWGFERPGDPDVWFSKNLIDFERLEYKPWWINFYESRQTRVHINKKRKSSEL